MGKKLKDRNGKPIYSIPTSKEYKYGYDKIKWKKDKKVK